MIVTYHNLYAVVLTSMTMLVLIFELLILYYSLEDYIQVLEKEVNIDFCWSMNRIIFDKTVEEDPVTFAFVTKPEKKEEVVPVKG